MDCWVGERRGCRFCWEMNRRACSRGGFRGRDVKEVRVDVTGVIGERRL